MTAPLQIRWLAVTLTLALANAGAAQAWTPESQQLIAEEAGRLAPPDLYRQLVKHRGAFVEGVLAPFDDSTPARHVQNPDGTGELLQAIRTSVQTAVQAIEAHQPFREVVFQMGQVAHFVADANSPLNCSQADGQETRYFADYLRYMESTHDRVKLLFFGFRPVETSTQLDTLLQEILDRCRGYYPLVGREYRRIGFNSGVRSFDDRSTAYGVAALSLSHAVSDIAEVLRYIWLRAGGADRRLNVPLRHHPALQLNRKTARP